MSAIEQVTSQNLERLESILDLENIKLGRISKNEELFNLKECMLEIEKEYEKLSSSFQQKINILSYV